LQFKAYSGRGARCELSPCLPCPLVPLPFPLFLINIPLPRNKEWDTVFWEKTVNTVMFYL
ncbi:hypothetical protein CEN39_21415, partial [Fischerella thermalis CCMEE 5201]